MAAATNHSPRSQPLRPGTPVLALSQGCVQAAKPQDAVHIQTLTTANQPCARIFSSRFLGDRVVNVHASRLFAGSKKTPCRARLL